MTRPYLLPLLLSALWLGVTASVSSNTGGMFTGGNAAFVPRRSRRRPQQKGRLAKKVRGSQFQAAAERRKLQFGSTTPVPTDITLLDGRMGMGYSDDGLEHYSSYPSSKASNSGSGSYSGTGSSKKSMKSMSKGATKSMKSTSNKGMSSKSMSGPTTPGNIFDHGPVMEGSIGSDGEVTEIVQVSCGTEERPFLTTFVTSIEIQPVEGGGKARKEVSSRKEPGKKKKKSKKGSAAYGDDDYERMDEDTEEDTMELPTDTLSPMEQRLLETTFREVYNALAYEDCDGFFRTVYTVSMTYVEPDDEDENYEVTLMDTYETDGRDEVRLFVMNGTMSEKLMNSSGLPRRRLQETNNMFVRSAQNSSSAHGGNGTKALPAPTKEGSSDDEPVTHAQTVTGGENRPIYYVSFAATCRNCDVTDEVNFPLLMLPNDDAYGRSGLDMGVPETRQSEAAEDGNCTCPMVVDSSLEEISRRQRHRKLDGHNLIAPRPNGPTAAEFIDAMNDAIHIIQENEGQLLRVAGLVELIEPDYFQGENPEQELPPTAVPTISPMPTSTISPSAAPSVSSVPTLTPAPSVGDNITDTDFPTDSPTNGAVLTRLPTTAAPTESREIPEEQSASPVHAIWCSAASLLLILSSTMLQL